MAAKQEAELLQMLHCPNIIQCVDVIADDRRVVMVMEYAAGGDLDGLLRSAKDRNGPLREREIMRIFIQIALALAYLHDHGVLHRDLKPKNILLDAQGVVKLTDFGVSRSLKHTMDAAETIIGTPTYMSPELMDNLPYDGKSDVWGLGCVLYELAALTPPFQGKAMGTLVMQIVSASPPPLPSRYTQDFETLVLQLLTKNPMHRPSAREIIGSGFVLNHAYAIASQAPSEVRLPTRLDGPVEVHPQTAGVRAAPATNIPQPPARGLIAEEFQGNPDAQTELARQIFFENQAAARRNKERVDREKSAPSPFSCPSDEAPSKHQAPERGNQKRTNDIPPDHARQHYLENLQAAKMNKLRALEAMKGSSLPEPPEIATQCVPPPPQSKRLPSANPQAYEELLDAERRRVRMERKALLDRMRAQQTQDAPSDLVVESTDGAETIPMR
ncbi:hypothetical protein Poli38472_003294 [Pythium oligandrum]|uniref:non-specific serine/threonine protein kinase n=1 Tax=Pythium oligandrum TaxID=41045 RepID=A0A8K1C691_PYTOL|nr:hypothetical protein Poli38472_003294 [Pythium oligandrum]|eukprot:TMW57369.1 hypothetical protein Poli38472_003294 [Pythium oligandrum]